MGMFITGSARTSTINIEYVLECTYMSRPRFTDEIVGPIITSELPNWPDKRESAEEIASVTRMRLLDIPYIKDDEIETNRERIRSTVIKTIEQQKNLPSLHTLLGTMPQDHYETLFETPFWFGAEDIVPLFKAGQKDRLKRYGREDTRESHDYTVEGVALSAYLFHLLREKLPTEVCDRFKSVVLGKVVPGWHAANEGPIYEEAKNALLDFFRTLTNDELKEFQELNYAVSNYASRIEELGTIETQAMYPPKVGDAGLEFLSLGRKNKDPEHFKSFKHSIHSFGTVRRWYGNASWQVSEERESTKK